MKISKIFRFLANNVRVNKIATKSFSFFSDQEPGMCTVSEEQSRPPPPLHSICRNHLQGVRDQYGCFYNIIPRNNCDNSAEPAELPTIPPERCCSDLVFSYSWIFRCVSNRYQFQRLLPIWRYRCEFGRSPLRAASHFPSLFRRDVLDLIQKSYRGVI